MGKSVNKMMHLLAIIDIKDQVSPDAWLDIESELDESLELLLEWGFIDKINNEIVLSDKGKNALNYLSNRGKEVQTPTEPYVTR